MLYLDHEALKYINGQHKLNNRHPRWVKFLQAFTFVIRYKVGVQSQVVDALSQRHSLLTMQIQVLGFEVLKELYRDDPYFGNIGLECVVIFLILF